MVKRKADPGKPATNRITSALPRGTIAKKKKVEVGPLNQFFTAGKPSVGKSTSTIHTHPDKSTTPLLSAPVSFDLEIGSSSGTAFLSTSISQESIQSPGKRKLPAPPDSDDDVPSLAFDRSSSGRVSFSSSISQESIQPPGKQKLPALPEITGIDSDYECSSDFDETNSMDSSPEDEYVEETPQDILHELDGLDFGTRLILESLEGEDDVPSLEESNDATDSEANTGSSNPYPIIGLFNDCSAEDLSIQNFIDMFPPADSLFSTMPSVPGVGPASSSSSSSHPRPSSTRADSSLASSGDDLIDALFDEFVASEILASGESSDQLCTPSGSLKDPLLVVLHYPTLVTKTPNFGSIRDPTNPCLRWILNHLKGAENVLILDWFWRRYSRKRENINRFMPYLDKYDRGVVELHREFTSNLMNLSDAKFVLLMGGPSRQLYQESIATRAEFYAIGRYQHSDRKTGGVFLERSPSGDVTRILFSVPHPEWFLRKAGFHKKQWNNGVAWLINMAILLSLGTPGSVPLNSTFEIPGAVPLARDPSFSALDEMRLGLAYDAMNDVANSKDPMTRLAIAMSTMDPDKRPTEAHRQDIMRRLQKASNEPSYFRSKRYANIILSGPSPADVQERIRRSDFYQTKESVWRRTFVERKKNGTTKPRPVIREEDLTPARIEQRHRQREWNRASRLGLKTPLSLRTRKACEHCLILRISCDGETPCSNCVASGNDCVHLPAGSELPRPIINVVYAKVCVHCQRVGGGVGPACKDTPCGRCKKRGLRCVRLPKYHPQSCCDGCTEIGNTRKKRVDVNGELLPKCDLTDDCSACKMRGVECVWMIRGLRAKMLKDAGL